MKTHLIIVWITAFGMIACNSRPQTDAEEEAIKEDTIAILDFASAISKEVPDTFTWNSVAKKVTYIPRLLLPSYGRTPRDKLSW